MTIVHQLKTRFKVTHLQTDSIIGTDLLANLYKIPAVGKKNFNAFLVLTDETVFNLYGKLVSDSLAKTNKKVIFSIIKAGEKQKDITVLAERVKPFFDQGFDRNSCLIALGGGVVTDIGGFMASILLRGINLINIPTTLIGQADAAIGGKNGVNLWSDNHFYKNMLGTFKQPSLVISDVDPLSTLPEKEILNGLGEIVKYWIGWGKPKQSQISNLKSQIDKMLKTPRRCPEDSSEVEELIKTIFLCQQIKTDIIRQDPFDRFHIREKLNLGHTVGHAIEAVSNGKITHGQAVGLGLVGIAKISLRMNFLQPLKYKKIIKTIAELGLPTSTVNLKIDEVLSAIKTDKKSGNFILIKDIGQLLTNVIVDKKIISEVLSEMIV